MDNAGYTSLTRQSGLLREMQLVANNIANVSTTGYRREGLLFAEHIEALGPDDPSLSMASGGVRATSYVQGALTETGGTYDLAIEGDGFFILQTPDGNALTRAGSFTPNAEGELVSPDGYRVLDIGQAAIFIPPDAVSVSVSRDGTLSADGRPLAQIGIFAPNDPNDMARKDGVQFLVPGRAEPIEDGLVLQGFLENSNVNSVSEIARMIEIQRAYELGQTLLDQEHERIRNVMQTLSR